MNADLEAELKENPELASVVARLRAGKEVDATSEVRGQRSEVRQWNLRTASWLVAASLLLFVGLAVILNSQPPTLNTQPSTLNSQSSTAYGAREYHLTVDEMIASQNGDGSWGNDFQTRRNAAALERETSPAARIAYKKAMRNLRTKGVL